MKRLSAGPLFFLPLLASCQMTSETPLEPNARTLVRSPQGDPHAALPMSIPAVAWSRDISAPGYVDGAPIGGFGAGTITMRYDGGFYTGRLKIGNNDLTVDASSSFHLYQKPEGQPAVTKKLDAASGGDHRGAVPSFPSAIHPRLHLRRVGAWTLHSTAIPCGLDRPVVTRSSTPEPSRLARWIFLAWGSVQ